MAELKVADSWGDAAWGCPALIGDVCGNGPDEAALGVGLRFGWRTPTLAGLRKADRMRLLEQVLVAERPHDGIFATVCTVASPPAATKSSCSAPAIPRL